MLAQRLGNSINSTDAWYPTDGENLAAFWEFKRLGNSNISSVDTWLDTGERGRNLVQETEGNQPSYVGATGAVVFDGSDHLSTDSSFNLTGGFVVGFRLSFDALSNEVLLASNTTANNFIRVVDLDTINVKFGGTLGTIDFNTGTDFTTDGEKYSVVIARNDSDVVYVYIDGERQTDTVTKSGTFVVDTIGVRATDTNDFEGSMFECVIYNSFNAQKITELNTRLNSL